MIKIIIKLIEFFLKSVIIRSQREQMPQKVYPMLTKSMFKNIKRCTKFSSSMLTSIQVLHQQIRGEGVLVCADSGLKLWKTGRHNT